MDEEQIKFITDTDNNTFIWTSDSEGKIIGCLIYSNEASSKAISQLILERIGHTTLDIQRILDTPKEELQILAKLAKIKYLKREVEALENEVSIVKD